jgi:hypothetical protein
MEFNSIWVPSSACLDLTRVSMSSHLLGCIKEQMAIPLVHAAEEPSQLQIKLAILHRFDLRLTEIVTADKRMWGLLTFVENLPERHVERSRELLQSLNVRNRVAIFESGDITAKKASVFFDVALAPVLRFAELA